MCMHIMRYYVFNYYVYSSQTKKYYHVCQIFNSKSTVQMKTSLLDDIFHN